MTDLSQYLRNRGLELEPLALDAKPILDTPELTREVADLWRGHSGAITTVIQTRANAIAKKVLFNAMPEEVVVLRQALVELGAIVKDFESYAAEQDRRDKEKEA